MSLSKWKKDFEVPMQFRNVPSTWSVINDLDQTCALTGDYRFSLFQCVSAYTNTGTSLVDQSMVPFQTAYPTIVCMIFLILAGNTAFVSISVDVLQLLFLIMSQSSLYCK